MRGHLPPDLVLTNAADLEAALVRLCESTLPKLTLDTAAPDWKTKREREWRQIGGRGQLALAVEGLMCFIVPILWIASKLHIISEQLLGIGSPLWRGVVFWIAFDIGWILVLFAATYGCMRAFAKLTRTAPMADRLLYHKAFGNEVEVYCPLFSYLGTLSFAAWYFSLAGCGKTPFQSQNRLTQVRKLLIPRSAAVSFGPFVTLQNPFSATC
jgi:hypothetical protein